MLKITIYNGFDFNAMRYDTIRYDPRDIMCVMGMHKPMPEQNNRANNFSMKIFVFGAENEITNTVNSLKSSGAKLFYISFLFCFFFCIFH